MANETTVQTSYIQEDYEADECQENIPPRATVAAETSKLKVQVGDVVEYPSIQPSGENEPLSDTCTFSTPAPTSSSGGLKAKSRLSGVQSALTPILKNLDIGNKWPSPEPSKHGNNPHLTVPCFSFGNTTANCQKSPGGSSQHLSSDFSSSLSGRSLSDTNASVHWLRDEYFPEMTLLDVTCDSTVHLTKNDSAFPDSVPSTPVTAQSASTYTTLQHSQVSASPNLKTTAQIPSPQNKTLGLNQSLQKQDGTVTVSETSSSDSDENTVDKSSPPKVFNAKENHSQVCPPELSKHNGTTPSKYSNAKMYDIPENIDLPLRWLDDRYFPEITLLDVTHDSEFSPGEEMPSTQDNPPVNSSQNSMPSSELSGQVVAEHGTLNVNQSDDTSSTLDGSATRTIGSFSEKSVMCVSVNTTKASLEATRDISVGSVMEDSQPSLESSGQNMAKIQTSAEGTHGTHPANVTHDISSSSNMSVQVAATQFSTSDVQCNTSSKNVTLELPGEPGVTSDTVEATSEELLISHDIELTSKVPQPSPKQAGSVNSTFDWKKSTGNTILAEAGATTVCLQNVTFEAKSSEQNGTITLSETSSNDSHHNTLDKPSPPEVFHTTSSPKDNNSDVHFPEQSKHKSTTSVTDPKAKMADTPESTPETTFEANPTVDVPSEAGHHETKDHLQAGLPMRDDLSDTLGHQSMDAEDNKTNTLNLDDTLDLRADCLVTSTPMTNKIINIHTAQDEGKAMAAQKKLYGDGPSKPGGQAPSDVPSNVVCDRKTFLPQPAAVSLLPPLKAASKLFKCKLASTLSGRAEPLTSGLPMTRQRTQAMMRQKIQSEALRNTAASDAPQKNTGISTSSNSRATLTGSKQPSPGKPRLGGIPSGIQRAALGLRPPSARSNAPASSKTDQLRGPTASNPATKILQAAKHPLTGSEALPIAKKKRMDAQLPSGSAEAPKSSSVAANRTKNLKQPTTNQRTLPAKSQRDDAAVPASTAETLASCNAVSRAKALKQPVSNHRSLLSKPPIHSCAKCAVLEQQLEMKSEEIRRLKEELLKYSNPAEDC